MDKPGDLEAKYQKLATEYSKVRSQATVLKKAVLEEQAKNNELKDTIKKHEQKIRKHDQEMESLTFRNEQLTKRISVLQQELQVNSHVKKGKNKSTENIIQSDTSVLDEELQKKILENAQLVSSMADKEYELSDCKERIAWLEKRLDNCEKEYHQKETKYLEDIAKLKRAKYEVEKKVEEQHMDVLNSDVASNKSSEDQNEVTFWKEEAERWRSECEVLRSKPQSNERLTEYYESQLGELLQAKQMAFSETKTLWGENQALYSRLEHLTVVNKEIEGNLEKSNEELLTTIENYKSQLDAMTEHIAAQNDKITKQCDEIQALKHKIASKK
ncbi:protein phosphatase 1 regulatory subunit 21 [Tribolium castaneum]|uniref:Protein phosphatase 1 regulatory subunit 21-like Protein n=1 Tax=Tribolium castaneum TaxID=7070 RepID=D6WQF2_TRICA|nr:PREDICTED: protein phosphatase 1 regulatory subunit 21 [Tribolium castaneum]EFA06081.1 Protein phosphatase 1 regulatory subunit 21-like Protein [Tribolium castaneum]|eukprot:XP_974102.1 PREDICTED: protein phosphatase 1 regulatory subunit 21 [Tribolium castaneum]